LSHPALAGARIPDGGYFACPRNPSMLDPVDRAIANAPFEDEPISEEENRAVAASKAWLKDHDPIPNEEVLAEFGLTADDFDRMGQTPLDPESNHPGR
jgi:hypothetical protein